MTSTRRRFRGPAVAGKTHDSLIHASSGAAPSLVDALIVRATVK